jgi:GH15 family glucan-1,4-alpha-glucosidase
MKICTPPGRHPNSHPSACAWVKVRNRLFERMLGYAVHLGLYSEQPGPRGEALGNFLQAFTHLAVISAAFNLDRRLGN